MLKLRGTQEEFVKHGVEVLQSKSTAKQVMVAPVAYGKSICIANIVARLDAPTIILQPNKELLEQNYAKYTSYGYEATIFSASLQQKELSKVTYATIGSIKSHVSDVKRLGFKYIIIDECHLGTGRKSTIDKFIKQANIKNVLGVTATPVILTSSYDGSVLKMLNRSKNNMFSSIHHVVQISELVSAGYWSKLKYDLRVQKMEGLEWNTSGSEYTQESIEIAYKISGTRDGVMNSLRRLYKEGRKSILVFVPSIKEAQELAKKVPNSAAVSSKTPKKERTRIIEGFKAGTIWAVFNVQVLTAGFDHPQLDAIVLARPTASIALYYQMLGRGTRIHPEKDDTKIVDLSGNVSNFGPIELLNYEYIPGYGWGMYAGDELLTDIVGGDVIKRPTKDGLKKQVYEQHLKDSGDVRAKEMPLGKYKGMMLKDVPRHYLAWMLREFQFNGIKMMNLRDAIEGVLQRPIQ